MLYTSSQCSPANESKPVPIDELTKITTEVPLPLNIRHSVSNVQLRLVSNDLQACDTTLADAKEYDHTKVADWNSRIIVRFPGPLANDYMHMLMNCLAERNPQSPHFRNNPLQPLRSRPLPLHRQQHHRATRHRRQILRRRGRAEQCRQARAALGCGGILGCESRWDVDVQVSRG